MFKDRIAGTLAETASGGSRFTYSELWTEAIACSLPVDRREHEWATGLHPFFQHLGPEGWLRERQARTGHLAEEDDFGLLLRYGADCIGAVGVRPHDPSFAAGPAVELTASPGRTVSGIQKKLLAVRDAEGRFHAAGPEGVAPYIAKFNSEALPTLVRNEALTLRWLRAVLGDAEVTKSELATLVDLNETGLIVTRFDRTEGGEKLRLEDFAQILNRPRGRDFGGKYDGSYEEVAAVIREHSARAQIDLARLFRRIVAFVLVGNADAHLKNFSLLETPEGLRLSPAYDVVNTVIYPGYDQEFALALGDARKQIEAVTRADLVAYGGRIGVPPRVVAQTLAGLARATRQAAAIIEPPAAEDPNGFITRYSDIVRRACARILEE